jgi:hypothetical protein
VLHRGPEEARGAGDDPHGDVDASLSSLIQDQAEE